MSFAPALVLRGGDRKKLGDLARLPSVPSGLAKRARMVLPAAGGLTSAIGRFVDACNQRCQPFTWTKDAGELIAKIKPSKN